MKIEELVQRLFIELIAHNDYASFEIASRDAIRGACALMLSYDEHHKDLMCGKYDEVLKELDAI